jgi:hypothetical protein
MENKNDLDKCTAKTHCKNALQKRTAKTHCKNAPQNLTCKWILNNHHSNLVIGGFAGKDLFVVGAADDDVAVRNEPVEAVAPAEIKSVGRRNSPARSGDFSVGECTDEQQTFAVFVQNP